MRRFLNLLKCDVACGFACIAGRLVLIACICAAAMFVSWAKIQIRLPEAATSLTFGEALLCIWYGMLPYNPSEGEMFRFPMAWFCLLCAISFAIADYPSREIGGIGSAVIVSCVSRWAWWLAKCAWVVLAVLAGVAISALIAFVWEVAASGAFSLMVRPGVAAVLEAGYSYDILDASRLISEGGAAQVARASAVLPIGEALLGLVVCLVGIALVQNAVSLLSHPIIGMAVTISILFVSAYFFEAWLPGEYLLLARTDVLLDSGDLTGVQPLWGVGLGCLLAFSGIVAGGIAFTTKDIVGRRDETR